MLKLAVPKGAKLLIPDSAVQQVAELIAVHLAGQAQRLRARALPFRRRQAAFGIIIIGLVIAGGLRRTGERGNGRDHHTGP